MRERQGRIFVEDCDKGGEMNEAGRSPEEKTRCVHMGAHTSENELCSGGKMNEAGRSARSEAVDSTPKKEEKVKVYHGSCRDFDRFRMGPEKAVFFTTSLDEAELYAMYRSQWGRAGEALIYTVEIDVSGAVRTGTDRDDEGNCRICTKLVGCNQQLCLCHDRVDADVYIREGGCPGDWDALIEADHIIVRDLSRVKILKVGLPGDEEFPDEDPPEGTCPDCWCPFEECYCEVVDEAGKEKKSKFENMSDDEFDAQVRLEWLSISLGQIDLNDS